MVRKRIIHTNNGACEKCDQIFDRYTDFYEPLRAWFEDFQSEHPEAHISCAGRGYEDQEYFFSIKTTKARYGQSSHNYNAAIDIFEMSVDFTDIYEISWFKNVLAPAIPDWLKWYGEPGSSFYELPHVEVRNWRELVHEGVLTLVETHDV